MQFENKRQKGLFCTFDHLNFRAKNMCKQTSKQNETARFVNSTEELDKCVKISVYIY